MNGDFKLWLTRYKREFLASQTGKSCWFLQTNIIPLVRKSWKQSFAKSKGAKNAIKERGWNPLNFGPLEFGTFR
jgi:hypothetical protein